MRRFGLDPGVNEEDDIQPVIIETPGSPVGEEEPTQDRIPTPGIGPGIGIRTPESDPPLDDEEGPTTIIPGVGRRRLPLPWQRWEIPQA